MKKALRPAPLQLLFVVLQLLCLLIVTVLAIAGVVLGLDVAIPGVTASVRIAGDLLIGNSMVAAFATFCAIGQAWEIN